MKKPRDVIQPRWGVYMLKRKAERMPFTVNARTAEEAIERAIKEYDVRPVIALIAAMTLSAGSSALAQIQPQEKACWGAKDVEYCRALLHREQVWQQLVRECTMARPSKSEPDRHHWVHFECVNELARQRGVTGLLAGPKMKRRLP
jgi:hypothetical protein